MNRLLQALVALVMLFGVVLLAVPYLLSSTTVKTNIEAQFSRLTGSRVTLNGESTISLNPYLGVSYQNVSLRKDDQNNPFLIVETMKARINLLSALTGNIKLSRLQLIRPKLDLTIDAHGATNWSVFYGSSGDNVLDDRNGTHDPVELGLIQIQDGIVTYEDHRSSSKQEFTAINGSVTWPTPDTPSNADLKGIWNGEAINVLSEVQNPFLLLTGGASEFSVSISSAPVELSYSGKIDTGEKHTTQGDLIFSSPSPQRLVEWTGANLRAFSLLGPMELTSRLVADSNQIKFDALSLSINGSKAQGRVQLLSKKNEARALNGTLAFQSIKLPSPDEIITSFFPHNDGNVALFDGLNMDLRLSAVSAEGDGLKLENIAATALVRDGLANIDIGQATVFGGELMGTFSVGGEENIELGANVTLTNINLSELTTLYGPGLMTLGGKGNARFKLKSVAPRKDEVMRHLNGDGFITGENGEITGLNLQTVLDAGETPQNINTSAVFSGSTDFEKIKLEFFIANGLAFLRNSELANSEYSVILGGRSDLAGRTLALRGKLIKQGEVQNEGKTIQTLTLPFFVGGTTTEPLYIGLPSKLTSNPIPEKSGTDQPSN